MSDRGWKAVEDLGTMLAVVAVMLMVTRCSMTTCAHCAGHPGPYTYGPVHERKRCDHCHVMGLDDLEVQRGAGSVREYYFTA